MNEPPKDTVIAWIASAVLTASAFLSLDIGYFAFTQNDKTGIVITTIGATGAIVLWVVALLLIRVEEK